MGMIASPQAAFICIGNEILSGKTRDSNLQVLAQWLGKRGVRLVEVRVIADIEAHIISTITELRNQYDYVFTSGGIGPTHDDITSASVARAFNVPLEFNADALEALTNHYKDEQKVTPSRKKMSCIPQGASLIKNPVSGAVGFSISNVHVLAGVPVIFKAMLEDLETVILGGDVWCSHSLEVYCGESTIAEQLGKIQKTYPSIEIGSYPKHNQVKKYYTELVFSGQNESLNAQAIEDTITLLNAKNISFCWQ